MGKRSIHIPMEKTREARQMLKEYAGARLRIEAYPRKRPTLLKQLKVDLSDYKEHMDFHNGIIEVKMLSRLLPDAPDFARGFIGIAFRINEGDSEFESFYVRPTNAMTDDPVRRAHGCQYFSYPGYKYAYFREYSIEGYEAPVESGLDEWIDLKAVVRDDCAVFYLNGAKKPTLVVKDLKHGKDAHGSVGLFVDIGTEGFFRDLRITRED